MSSQIFSQSQLWVRQVMSSHFHRANVYQPCSTSSSESTTVRILDESDPLVAPKVEFAQKRVEADRAKTANGDQFGSRTLILKSDLPVATIKTVLACSAPTYLFRVHAKVVGYHPEDFHLMVQPYCAECHTRSGLFLVFCSLDHPFILTRLTLIGFKWRS